MIIIGAGMAGLLAAGILRDEAKGIFEAQSSLPNNHTALLRFRSSVVGDALNIPFKKVKVLKSIDMEGLNPISAMLSYSMKTNGIATMRSIVSATGEIEERFIAPSDLVQRMASKVNCQIEHGFNYGRSFVLDNIKSKVPCISTLPMPILMNILDWKERPDFLSVGGYNITATVKSCDAYATLYIPDHLRQENRISITGDKLTIEVALPGLSQREIASLVNGYVETDEGSARLTETVAYATKKLGLYDNEIVDVKISEQRYAKILPIDESIRRNFIIWASEDHHVFSLGRFATWRPGLLLDDLVNDVRVIQKIAAGSRGYEARKGF